MIDQQLRLATWNIHRGIGRDGVQNLRRIALVIGEINPDLIGLQEVEQRAGESGDEAWSLKTLTGMELVVGPTMRHETDEYGNALLTRLPVLEVERYDLSVRHREPRGLLIAHLDWRGERLQVAVTHLGLRPGERRQQVRALIEHLTGRGRSPLILLGDFNEWLIWGRPLRWLHRHFGYARSPATFPSRWPLLRLDQILVDPPHRLRSLATLQSPLAKTASDHLPLTAFLAQ